MTTIRMSKEMIETLERVHGMGIEDIISEMIISEMLELWASDITTQKPIEVGANPSSFGVAFFGPTISIPVTEKILCEPFYLDGVEVVDTESNITVTGYFKVVDVDKHKKQDEPIEPLVVNRMSWVYSLEYKWLAEGDKVSNE